MMSPGSGVSPAMPAPSHPALRSGARGVLTMALYQLVFCVGFLCYLPVLAWRALFDRRYRSGFRTRQTI